LTQQVQRSAHCGIVHNGDHAAGQSPANLGWLIGGSPAVATHRRRAPAGG
jgi:hypothetical protein